MNKLHSLTFLAGTIACLLSVRASAASVPAAMSQLSLTTNQLQRLSRDLIPTDAQNFFRRGQAQLEREIDQLQRRPQFSGDRLLSIQDGVKMPSTLPELKEEEFQLQKQQH